MLPDQLIDRTTRRPNSFFGDGVVGHVSFAEPFCPGMRERIAVVLQRTGHAFRDRATLVCMEGPAFSSRAESLLHRSWGAHLIGMTALPEAKLAREAEMCYATVAMVTDWDCWRGEEEGVTLEMVLDTMRRNVADIKRALPGHRVGARGPVGLPLPARGGLGDHDRSRAHPGGGEAAAGPPLRQVLERHGMKSALVGIVGRPSAGKSTLMNRLCGAKVSIVSPVPQTTRNRVRGILNRPEGQLVFMDTPGFHLSEKKLNRYLTDLVSVTLGDSDIVLYLVDGTRAVGDEERALLEKLRSSAKPCIVAINKCDRKAI